MLVSGSGIVIALYVYNYTRLEVTSILFRKNSFYSSKDMQITFNLDTFQLIWQKMRFFE